MFVAWMLSLGYSVFPLRVGSKFPDSETLYQWHYRSPHAECNGRGCSRCWQGEVGSWAPLQSKRLSVEVCSNWDALPQRNLGLVTGAVSRLVVVDFDSEDDWTASQALLGKTGIGLVVRTRRGYHVYFRHPGREVRNHAGVRDRYDIRADGGYVVAPTSVIDGVEYRVIAGNLDRRDSWPVFDPAIWLDEREITQGPREVKRYQRYRETVLAEEFKRVSLAKNGCRHNSLKTSAVKLGSYVGGEVLERSECIGLLMGAAFNCGLPEAEARSCINAGLDIGQQRPRRWVNQL